MSIRRAMRESAFRLARHDVAAFLKDHEDEIIEIFRQEMAVFDSEVDEESLFIDIRMVPLGEAIVRAALRGIERFLRDDSLSESKKVRIKPRSGEGGLELKDSDT